MADREGQEVLAGPLPVERVRTERLADLRRAPQGVVLRAGCEVDLVHRRNR